MKQKPQQPNTGCAEPYQRQFRQWFIEAAVGTWSEEPKKPMKHSDIKAWTAQQDWSSGYAAVAQANGITYFTARRRAMQAKMPVQLMKRGRKVGTPNPSKRKIPADTQIDFTQRDAHIARALGISREYVRQLRKAAGVAPLPRGNKKHS